MNVLPSDYNDAASLGLLIVAVIYNLYSLVIVVVNAVQCAKGKMTARQSARMNLIIKGIQIPAYIMHFILGFIGLAMSVWGIGIILWAILIDLLTILLTGISSIGCSIRMRKEGILSTAAAILMGIGCFIYCVDVVIAIVYVVKARKNRHSGKNFEIARDPRRVVPVEVSFITLLAMYNAVLSYAKGFSVGYSMPFG